MRSCMVYTLAAGLLIVSSGCSTYVNVGLGGQARVAGASSGGGLRVSGGLGGTNLGVGRVRRGGGLGMRTWGASDDVIVAWGPEVRADVAIVDLRNSTPDKPRRLSLTSRVFVGYATNYGDEMGDETRTGSAFDASLGLSYDGIDAPRYTSRGDFRPGAWLVTPTVNLSRVPTLSGGTFWILGGTIEITGVFNIEYYTTRL